MKVFRVVTNKDGETTHILGEVSTKMIQIDRRYAANTIYDVIANLQIFVPEDEDLIAVIEEHPGIVVLDA
uniref:Uncharacterized protein n=1 Tax=viral metagenome TaxID=1070528 RepID=A0A6M3LSU5_9ZZZZ